MNSLPGGRLAPPPPVSRVAVGGIAFLLTAVFCFAWAGIGVLRDVTSKERAIELVGSSIRESTARELVAAIEKDPNAPRYEIVRDLVSFDVERAAVRDINIYDVLAQRRAAELYLRGFPRDPGPNRTFVSGVPRSFITLFTAHRHKQLQSAELAALFGVGAGMLICAFMATGAARFALPGASALLGYLFLRYHVLLVNFWFEKNGTEGLKYQVHFNLAANEPIRKLLFVAITLLVAGLVYSVLLGGTRAAIDERTSAKRKRKRAKARAAAKKKAAAKSGTATKSAGAKKAAAAKKAAPRKAAAAVATAPARRPRPKPEPEPEEDEELEEDEEWEDEEWEDEELDDDELEDEWDDEELEEEEEDEDGEVRS